MGLPGERIHFLDFTDGSISSEDAENFGRLREIFNRVRPTAVFVPHGGEGWPDHLAARRMGLELASEFASELAGGLAGTPAACRTGKSAEMPVGTPASGHAGKPADGLAGTPADASAGGLGGRAAVTVYEYSVWMWYYNVRHLDWRNALTLKMTREEHRRKLAAVDIYTKALAPCGKPWSGVLPPVFLRANRWHRELYFRVHSDENSEHFRVHCGENSGHFSASREEKTELQREVL